MCKIELHRITRPLIISQSGKHTMETVVESVAVTFAGPEGEVSLAFDGRYEVEEVGRGWKRETYRTYSDCPVIDADNIQSGRVDDREVLRLLRDALMDTDLGD